MKKVLAILLTMMLCLGLFAGCGGNDTNSADSGSNDAAAGNDAGSDAGESGGSNASDEGPIIIGSVNDLSGDRSVTGNAINRGAMLAAEEINANGGILGRQIEFISYDNKNDSQESINAYTRLVDVDGAVAVIAPDASSICMSLIEVSTEKQVAVVGMPSDPRATMNTETGEVYPYMFLVSQPNAVQQAKLMSDYLDANTEMTKAAVFYDQSNAYAVANVESFISQWEGKGHEVVITETCNANDQDFRTQLSKINNTDAEFIYTPNPTAQLVILVQQAAQLGIDLPYAGAMDMADPFLSLINDPMSISAAYFPAVAIMDDPKLDNLHAMYNEAFGEDAQVKTVNGYDAMYVLAEAIEQAGSTDPEAIRDALENSISGISLLVSENYSHDPATHAPKDLGMNIFKIEDGELHFLGWFE